MINILLQDKQISAARVEKEIRRWLESIPFALNKVLLLPPDITRSHSMAGLVVQTIYRLLSPTCQVEIMPAIGTHRPMSKEEKIKMFGTVITEEGCFFDHDWRHDVVKIGEAPGEYVAKVTGGMIDFPIEVEVNKRLLDKSYDLIVSIGQVVPHEVVGMANYTKNILVGCGGKNIINKSHFVGAAYGMEKMMGRDHTPVRKIFDYAEENFLSDLPLQYILTVTSSKRGATDLNGLFIGRDRRLFAEAVTVSQKQNLDMLDKPLRKVLVYLDPEEFKSTWVGNKAIYRTRMTIADGGELLILAPGLECFGEDETNDALIRKYGYIGSRRVLELVKKHQDLQANLSAAAHLIHGSSEGRFNITYAPGHLTKEEIEGVNFNYLSLTEAMAKYNVNGLVDGYNRLEDGEEIFYISNPALGLWALKEKFVL